jgi:hypothetical protein
MNETQKKINDRSFKFQTYMESFEKILKSQMKHQGNPKDMFEEI